MILLGLLFLLAGSFMVIKSDWMLNNFGAMSWFEAKLGSSGGSRLGYKLIGIIILFFGILFISGNYENFFLWALSPLMPKI